jgi:hypothetical protein
MYRVDNSSFLLASAFYPAKSHEKMQKISEECRKIQLIWKSSENSGKY